MKMMMALRRVSTPTRPITNNAAEKKSDSASIGSPTPQHDGADDRDEQQHARDLERQQILGEQRSRDGRDSALDRDVLRDVAGRERESLGYARPRQRENLREQRQPDGSSRQLPTRAARVHEL